MKLVLAFLSAAFVCNAETLVKRAAGDQSPKVFSALDQLRGGAERTLSVDQIQELFVNVKPGQDFPLIAEIPKASVDCGSFKQPGFYADTEGGQCQVFNRCDVNGNLTSYLCPNMTMFNQITLVCDWWYNIDCSKAKSFYDYSNSRLYQDSVPFLDDENDYVMAATGAVAAAPQKADAAAGGKAKGKAGKGKKKASA